MDYIPRGTRTMDHFILALTREFRSRGWDVRYAFGGELPPEFQRDLADAGGGYTVIPFPFTRSSAEEMIRKLDGYRPDVVQTSFLSSFSVPLLNLKRRGFAKRLVAIDHSSGETPRRTGLKGAFARLRGWWVGRIVDAIVPVSAAIAKRDIERVFLPAEKIRVVYNGIQLSLFPSPTRPTRGLLRVVYAGQLIPEKGVLTLLRAHLRLRKAGVGNYELLVAGKGGQEAELKAFCATSGLDDVQFLGHIDSIPELFGTADVVVVPSAWYEAFGLVLAEAMACGAACLVSDAGALAEVAGEAGRVFRSGDDADLATKLKGLIDDPELCRSLGRAGRLRAEKLFTLERMVDEHIAVCEAVLKGKLQTFSDSQTAGNSEATRLAGG
jgi:glycosyltransferase involved in cell wall biosynthesis